jgi:hypothetical protein
MYYSVYRFTLYYKITPLFLYLVFSAIITATIISRLKQRDEPRRVERHTHYCRLLMGMQLTLRRVATVEEETSFSTTR